jgi:TPR repeat protein
MAFLNTEELSYDAYKGVRNTEPIRISTDESFIKFEQTSVNKIVEISYDMFHSFNVSLSNFKFKTVVALVFNISNTRCSKLETLIVKIKELVKFLDVPLDQVMQLQEEKKLEESIIFAAREKIDRESLLSFANEGNQEAQFEYALMCKKGKGGKVDLYTSREYFRLAADNDDRESQNNYAFMCLKGEGEGGGVNLKEARKYFGLAAGNGIRASQLSYAIMCYQGEGGPIDLEAARNNYEAAAEKSCEKSQNQFAGMCYQGKGGPVDLEKARVYFLLAADRGVMLAQYNYARMCELGRGGDVDLDDALIYYKNAADKGHEQAKKNYVQIYNQKKSEESLKNDCLSSDPIFIPKASRQREGDGDYWNSFT